MAWNKNVNTNAPSKSFIANLLEAGVAISGCAILFACGDDVTNENITQIVQENTAVVADVSKLPDCTPENEGQQALVKGEPSPRICVDGKWFAIFSDYTDKLDDFKCSAEKLKDGSGLKILCNGDSIGVVLNGSNGSNGVNGAQGIQGEKGDKGDTGAQGVQGEKGEKGDTGEQGIQGEKGDKGDTGEQGIQGEKGDKGDTGEGCSIERNGSLITITCGYQNAVINLNEIIANSNLGTCSSVNENEISKYENTYYICRSNVWVEASVLEYDTYRWESGIEGEVKEGSVVATNHYVYENGVWRETADEVEYNIGACVTSRDGEKKILSGQYYICHETYWDNVSEVVYNLGYCSSSRTGAVLAYEGVYYTCKSNAWTKSTSLEYNTYGKVCLTDGSIVSGEVNPENKYVCSANQFREANQLEISLDKGCVCYTENEEIRINISENLDSIYTCTNGLWIGSMDGTVYETTLLDKRDGKKYKIVAIDKQIWMAENLNYRYLGKTKDLDSSSFCYNNKSDNCAKYGRLYLWSAAMDSAGRFSTNGKNCGYTRTCSPTYPVRGICPEGWHLPDTTEWNALFAAVGGKANASKALKSSLGWPYESNLTDAFLFSALPAGLMSFNGGFIFEGAVASFWSSTEYSIYNAYYISLNQGHDDAIQRYERKDLGISVRCVKD